MDAAASATRQAQEDVFTKLRQVQKQYDKSCKELSQIQQQNEDLCVQLHQARQTATQEHQESLEALKPLALAHITVRERKCLLQVLKKQAGEMKAHDDGVRRQKAIKLGGLMENVQHMRQRIAEVENSTRAQQNKSLKKELQIIEASCDHLLNEVTQQKLSNEEMTRKRNELEESVKSEQLILQVTLEETAEKREKCKQNSVDTTRSRAQAELLRVRQSIANTQRSISELQRILDQHTRSQSRGTKRRQMSSSYSALPFANIPSAAKTPEKQREQKSKKKSSKLERMQQQALATQAEMADRRRRQDEMERKQEERRKEWAAERQADFQAHMEFQARMDQHEKAQAHMCSYSPPDDLPLDTGMANDILNKYSIPPLIDTDDENPFRLLRMCLLGLFPASKDKLKAELNSVLHSVHRLMRAVDLCGQTGAIRGKVLLLATARRELQGVLPLLHEFWNAVDPGDDTL